MELQGASGGGYARAAAPVRKPSMAGSMFGSAAAAGGRRVVPDFEFSLGAAKVKVLKGLEEGVPPAFVRFFNSALFDRLLHGLVLYFVALLQQELLQHWTERTRTAAHADGCNPALLAVHVREVEEEAASRRAELSQPYSELILKHSSYKNQQADKRFFESLYTALAAVLHEAFDKLGRRELLDTELGRLFRGKHFNVGARVHGPGRSADSMTVMQLWEVKHETANRALHAQLINSLFEKAPALSVQVAAVSNTPLVSQAVRSPMVARSLLADPAERDTLLALPYSRTAKDKGGSSSKSSGRQQGGRPEDGGPLPGSSTHPAAAAAAAAAAGGSSGPVLLSSSSMSVAGPGSAASSPGPRASTIGRPFQGVVASLPEAGGLPYDEKYAYLCLLRRSVLYGPTLGLPTAPAASGGGRSSMMSFNGAAPGTLSHSNSMVY